MENFIIEQLDNLDKAILKMLQTEGRISNVDLATRVNLSPPAVHARIKRLEQRGYIDKYVALLNREQLGFDLLCFVSVTLQRHAAETVEGFQTAVKNMPEVMDCYHITGEYDYLLKVVVRNRHDLEHFVLNRLTPIPGLARIHTSVVLTDVKSSTVLPVEVEEVGKEG